MTCGRPVGSELAGLQLAFFETVWPAFEWIESVVLEATAGGKQKIRVLCMSLPSTQERAECKAMILEVLSESIQFRDAEVLIEPSSPTRTELPQGTTELISEAVFKAIARDFAPWRLELGR